MIKGTHVLDPITSMPIVEVDTLVNNKHCNRSIVLTTVVTGFGLLLPTLVQLPYQRQTLHREIGHDLHRTTNRVPFSITAM